jgi:dihydroorotate dehydrogenase (NAD+) catalytic subunit
MVWQVYNAVQIPIIGMGGIMNAEDAIEFMLAGASAVQIGTAIFKNPLIPIEVIRGIETYLHRHQIPDIRLLTGMLQM